MLILKIIRTIANLANIILLILSIVASKCDAKWSYLNEDDWAKEFTLCAGKRQSPVAITADNVIVDSTVNPIRFQGYNTLLNDVKMTNDGHSLKFQHQADQPAVISHGPLQSKYNWAQMHFHWGSNDESGSEHTIGSRHYAAELHMVHTKHGLTLDQSVRDPKGLAVLGIFFEQSDVADNPALEPIFDEIKRVSAGGSTNLKGSFSLRHFLPADTSNFFFYNGSLTTPMCSEVVTWIVFSYPSFIGTNQLEKLRKLDSSEVDKNGTRITLSKNYRKTQPLYGRKIKLRKRLVYSLPISSAFVDAKFFSMSGFFVIVMTSCFYNALKFA